MRRLGVFLAMMMVVAACETTANPLDGIISGGGGALTQTQAAGNWSFTLQQTTTLPCSSAPLANGTVIATHLDVLTDGTVSSSTSTWVNPITAGVQTLSGSITLGNGITDLTFTGSGSSAMEMQGTMTAAGSFNGTLTDPRAGSSQVFGSGGCEYTATGTKTS